MSFILIIFNFSFVLNRIGLSIENFKVIIQDYDSNNELYRIVRIDTKGEKVALVELIKKYGLFWKVISIKEEKEGSNGLTSIG